MSLAVATAARTRPGVVDPARTRLAAKKRPRSGTVPGPGLDGLTVALAVLGPQSSAFVAAALEQAGAVVRLTPSLGGTRRMLGPSGPRATVVLSPPQTTGAIRAGLRVLSRHGAVLVVLSSATTRERVDLLGSGADYVVASVDPDEIVAALAAVVRRSRLTDSLQRTQLVLHAGEVAVNVLQRTASAAGRPLALTPLEFDLLAYLAAHAGEAVSRDRLLEDVWGYDIGGRATVTVHVRRLRRKLESDPARPTRLQTVRGTGYRLNADCYDSTHS